MREITKRRIRRFLASGSPILFLGGTALVGAATQLAAKANWGLLIGIVVGVILVLTQMYFEYRKRTYDPSIAFKFDDIFNGSEMRPIRSKAAMFLRDEATKHNLAYARSGDVDDILDVLEDLGFYVIGDQLSPEVAHHAFHYWIRGYFSATRPYVEEAQKNTPSQWENISRLLDITYEIDSERGQDKPKKILEGSEITDFLDEEIRFNK